MTMMQPTFILSYPRSRTAWLSVFLTGAGAFCFHEAWQHVTTAKQLRALMESKGPGPVVNSDCSNIFFLDELKQEFPEARYIRIVNDELNVLHSLRESYGPHDYSELFEAYRIAFDEVSADLTVDCREWDERDTRAIWSIVAGNLPLDPHWVTQCEGMLVQLMPEKIKRDIHRGELGELSHLVERMRGLSWR